jgi:hypothetical protein
MGAIQVKKIAPLSWEPEIELHVISFFFFENNRRGSPYCAFIELKSNGIQRVNTDEKMESLEMD